jgi:predicted permease
MRTVRAWLVRLGGLFGKRRRDRELTEELESHLRMHIQDNLQAGMTPGEARREALIKLGGMESVKELYRDHRGVPWLETTIQDLRYAARTLRKNPGFTAVVVLTLALGIGVNTAIFSLVNAVMLRAPPYPKPDELVEVMVVRPKLPTIDVFWGPEVLAWQERNQVFSQFGVYREGDWDMTGGEEAERVKVGHVSTEFLPALDVQPLLGRNFANDEDKPSGPPVAILSYGLWQRRFGGDTNVIGRSITINHVVNTIVGVLPSSFRAPLPYMFWNTHWDLLQPVRLANGVSGGFWAFGRLKPGITTDQAQASLDVLYEPFRDSVRKDRIALLRLQNYLAGHTRSRLFLWQCAVGFILLIAFVNVANLLLARATRRQREVAIRIALGAGRLRIIRQLLTESVLLALLGSVFGLLLAFGIKDAAHLLLPDLRNVSSVAFDGRVLAFTFLAALLPGLVFGLAPALVASRVSLNETLKEGCRSMTGGRPRHRLQATLVIAEVALAFLLLTGAGLLLKCFFHMRGLETGFRTDRLLTITVELSGKGYCSGPSQTSYFQRAIEELRSLPGVEMVGADSAMPVVGPYEGTRYWADVEGQTNLVRCGTVNPEYFQALGIPLKEGCGFTDGDRTGAPQVVLVNESFVRRYLPGKQAIGQRIRCGDRETDWNWKTIVGVVGDVREPGGYWGDFTSGTYRAAPPTEASPRVYFCYLQKCESGMGLALRTQIDPKTLTTAARARLRSLDPEQVVDEPKTMEQRVSESLVQQRTNMWLSGALGSVALMLASVGIYGVLSFVVAQRTHEMGLRRALGAQRPDVIKLIVLQGARLIAIGGLIGAVGAFGANRFLGSLLYGISPTDPWTFLVVFAVLGSVAFLACYVPAWRAAKVDPMQALRYE